MRIGATDGDRRPKIQETIPPLNDLREWTLSDKSGEKSKEEAVEPRWQLGLKLAEAIPELKSREITYGPVLPGNIRFIECWSGRIEGVSQECKSAAAPHGLQEGSSVLAVLSQLAAGAKHKQVVLLRISRSIVDLLTREHEYPPPSRLHVAVDALNQHVVVRYEHNIQPGSDRSFGYLSMASGAVGIQGVHVQIHDNFVHPPLHELG
jgi:hypothetical protein